MSNHLQNHNYRPDIDGLRAIAVIIITLYHLDINLFSGGFIGVDIFFIISGFLIIPRIIDEISTGSFSLKNFYIRRARRIMPALLITLITTVIAGFFILTPREYSETAFSGLAALFSAANFFFYDRSGYFADSAHQKPLLHTWSLGVEEQFYILFPLIILMIYKLCKKSRSDNIIILFYLTIIISLIYNLIFTHFINPSHGFFMIISRFWEFGLGGVTAIFITRNNTLKQKQHFSSITGIIGIIAILYPSIFFTNRLDFPGIYALLPTIGTILIIISTGQKNIITTILSSKIPVFIGRISYSIYLLHWPIIVYYRLLIARPFDNIEKSVILTITILLSYLMYKYVETPMRAGKSNLTNRTALQITVTLSILLITLSAPIIYTKGVTLRLDDKATNLINNFNKNEAKYKTNKTTKCIKDFEILVTDKGRKYSSCLIGSTASSDDLDNLQIDYVIWGDSHAAMLMPALSETLSRNNMNGLLFSMPDCSPLINTKVSKRKNQKYCPDYTNKIIDFIKIHNIRNVIIASRWANLESDDLAPGDGEPSRIISDLSTNKTIDFYTAISRTITKIKQTGTSLIIISSVPEIAFHVPDTAIRVANNIGEMPKTNFADFVSRQKHVLQAFKKLENLNNVKIIYPHKTLCDHQYCNIILNNSPLYKDDDHLSNLGVELILPKIINNIHYREFK